MNTTDTAPTYEAPTGVPVITGRFQVMPPPTLEEYLALDRSIWEYGVRVPVIKDENGDIIDGHYRNEIATRRGITCLYRPAFDLLDAEKIAMAITLNVDRRHLNSEQKRELLAKSIKAQPKLSDSEHARRTGSSDKTATKVRSNLEATSEIPKLDETVGADGKTRPAKKPPAKKATAKEATAKEPQTPRRSHKALQIDAITNFLTEVANGFEYLKTKRYKVVLADEPDLRNALARLDMVQPENDAYESRVRSEVRRRLERTIKDYRELKEKADRVVNGRKGIITRSDHDLIRSCLHPDSRKSATDEKLAAAFRVFNEAEILFLSEKDCPTKKMDLPSSVDELLKRRRA